MPSKKEPRWQTRDNQYEGCSHRYRNISTRIWNDARFRALSPEAQRVFLYLLTNPNTTAVPGLFPLRESTAAEALKMTLEGFREGFREVFRQGMAEADWDAGVVWVRKVWKYEPPTGPNVVKQWRRFIQHELPESPLVAEALEGIHQGLRGLYINPQPFLDTFMEVFGNPSRNPSPIQEAGSRRQEAGVFLSPNALPKEEGGAGGSASAPPPEPPAPDFLLEGEGSALASGQPPAPDAPPTHPSEPPPERAERRTRARKAPADREADAALEALRNQLAEDFSDAKGVPYGRPDSDVKALKAMRKKPGGTDEEIRRRWGIGLRIKGFPKIATLQELALKWDHCAQAPEQPQAPPANGRLKPSGFGKPPPEETHPCEWHECGEGTHTKVWGQWVCAEHFLEASRAGAAQAVNGAHA